MATTELKRRDGAVVDAARIAAFAEAFRGAVVAPSHAEYEQARHIWNGAIDKRPGLIVRCSGTADVVRAVRFARDNDVLVAVRGGGHNVAGRALCDDGLVIDLSAMRGVFVDPKTRTVRAQGGAQLGDLDAEAHLHGLAVPAGVVSRTGIAGLTLGGGFGWLMRKYGLTIDNLLACEVVTAEGEILTASTDSHPDLFWALRGGGGNFGIVTSFLFRAQPVSTVFGGLILYPRNQAKSVLQTLREFVPSAPDELVAHAGLVTLPDGTEAAGFIVCHCGNPIDGARVIAPLRSLGTPLLDTVQAVPFPVMQTIFDDNFPDRAYNYWKSTTLNELSDAAIETIVEQANRATPMSAIVIEYTGGAVSRVGVTETAFAQRRPEFVAGITGQWIGPGEGATAWVRATWDALQPYSTGSMLLNFTSDGGQALVRRAFGANYDRLVQVKMKYDPTNFFSLNQNIAPVARDLVAEGALMSAG